MLSPVVAHRSYKYSPDRAECCRENDSLPLKINESQHNHDSEVADEMKMSESDPKSQETDVRKRLNAEFLLLQNWQTVRKSARRHLIESRISFSESSAKSGRSKLRQNLEKEL